MFKQKSITIFVIVICMFFIALPVSAQQFRGIPSSPKPKPQEKKPERFVPTIPQKPIRPLQPPKPTPPKQTGPSEAEQWGKIIGGIINSIPSKPDPGPVIVEGENWLQPSWVICRNCGASVRSDQFRYHRCRQQTVVPQRPPVTVQQKPQVTVGNPLPPAKPTVATGNHTVPKLATFNLHNVQALQNSIVSPLIHSQIEELEQQMTDDQIALIISEVGVKIQPPLSAKDTDAMMDAIRNGDVDEVKKILDNYAVTGEDQSTLTGLAGIKDILNEHENVGSIKQSDIKNVLDTLQGTTLLDHLTASVQTLGEINKIGTILDSALSVLGNGNSLAGINIPTGIVPLVTFPDLPFGVIFPLGNGVYGIGTGGHGNVGIYQGYIPQPPIYGGSSIQTTVANNLIISNDTGESITYYVDDSEASTLNNDSWQSWSAQSNQVRVKLPSGRGNSWTVSNITPGSYEVSRASNGGWTLKAVKTEVTISSPGNPIPFTFFIGSDKYMIEPEKSITLNDPQGRNSVYEIQFARSTDKEDVATYNVGGKQNYYVGREQADGKWSLFPDWAEKVNSAPQQSTATSSTLTYDDTPISTANVGGLPVLPRYE